MKTALMVMDLQEITVGSKAPFFVRYKKDLVKKANRIINDFDGDTVVYIRTVAKGANMLPKSYRPDAPSMQLAKDLKVVSNNIFEKTSGNAFTNPKLDAFLRKRGIDNIEIFGIDGSGCVYNTSRGAINNGYEVKVITDATDSYSRLLMKSRLKKLAKLGAKIK